MYSQSVRKFKGILIAAVVLGLSGCGVFSKDDDNKDRGIDQSRDQKGCIQGVAINGLTGERIALRGSDGEQGIHVIVRNKFLHANTHINGSSEDVDGSYRENYKGEYYICGVPTESTFPIVAFVDGYQRFEGTIKIDSTFKEGTSMSKEDDTFNALKGYPTLLADLVLYPEGTKAQNLAFTVLHYTDALKGAQVQLTALGNNELDDQVRQGPADEDADRGGNFAVAPQIRFTPAPQLTNKNGRVEFDGSDLVLGGVYEYKIIPVENRNIAVKTGTVTVGWGAGSGANLVSEPYEVVVSLKDIERKLKVVQQSTQGLDYRDDGRVDIVFNRPMEFVPRTEGSWSASLTGNNGATLIAEGTDRSVLVKIEGRRLILEPLWNIKPKEAREPNIAVTIQGIQLRPVGETLDIYNFPVPSVTVKLFD